MSGFLLRDRKRFTLERRTKLGPVSTLPSNITVAPLSSRLWSPSLEQIEGRDFRQSHSVRCGSGARSQTVSADLEEGTPATTTLGTAFPHQKSELHSGNVACYKLLSRNTRGLHNRGKRAVIMTDSRWIKDNDWNPFGTLRLPLP